jgi:hypothetical protein
MVVQLSVPGLYLPPVVKNSLLPPGSLPPQTIISLPVQIAVWAPLSDGAFIVLVEIQLSVPGLYLAPVFEKPPPHTIISLPVHTAVWDARPEGALVVLVSAQLSELGLYLPPVLK